MRKISVRSGHALVSLACVVAMSALAVGCSSSDETSSEHETLARAAQPIISGTPSTSDQDAVILLAIRSGGQLQGTCSGTLIAPNLVLTARHCVSDTDEGALCTKDGTPLQQGVVHSDHAPTDLYVYTGVDGIRLADDPTRAAARGKSVIHQQVQNICDADIAFIVLDQSIQGRVATIRLNSAAREGELLTAIGWGLTEAGGLPTTRQQRTGIAVQAVGPLVLDAQSNIGLGGSEFLVGESFCSGDSGGPSMSSKGAVVGVVSRGGGGAMNPNNPASNCVGSNVFNFYTQLDQKADLVMQAFAAAGATPRLEGDPPGVGVGEACKQDLDCSSNACVKGKCERRCDDGTKCAASELCTAVADKMVCEPAPQAPATPAAAPTAAPAPAAAAPAKTTTTTTSGCSAAPFGASSNGSVGIGLLFAAAALVAARRAKRA